MSLDNISCVDPSATDYKRYDQRTHVYTLADTYIGSDKKMARDEWVYNQTTQKMEYKSVTIVTGCDQIFKEILINASDNVGKSYKEGIDPGVIMVMMDNKTVKITNQGRVIPTDIHPEYNIHGPELIFGSLLTSSTYGEERYDVGKNGYGAKLTNIYSKRFLVEIIDHKKHIKYTQEWSDNMTICEPPVIVPYHSATISSVTVQYDMDFERFLYLPPNGDSGGYEPDYFHLFNRHCIDISFTAKIPVYFNGVKYMYSDIKDFASLYFKEEEIKTSIHHIQWDKDGKNKPGKRPVVEILALDTPDDGKAISFVNGACTKDGGVHVILTLELLSDSVLDIVNTTTLKKLSKLNKGKELDAKTKRLNTVSLRDVKPHISVIVSVYVMNPAYASQSKTLFESPTPTINIPDALIKNINQWSLTERLNAAIDAKQFLTFNFNKGKSLSHVKLENAIDANHAGKSDREKCVLIAVEGKSAAGYAEKYIGEEPGGRDYYGVFPMRGKPFNVTDQSILRIYKNEEIKELTKMLGLNDGLDYTTPSNYSKLRYGKLMIMADSDVDGKHIVALIINFFHCRYPCLLKLGFLCYYKTTNNSVELGDTKHKFYSKEEYEEWKVKNVDTYKKWVHKYYKGLGTSTNEEVRDDHKENKIIQLEYDTDASNVLKMAFNKNYSCDRKEWIGRSYIKTVHDGIKDEKKECISWFINNELILFSLADIVRSIPKLMDGFKESFRKIIHGAHLKWNISTKKKISDYPLYKVGRFSMFIAEKVIYQHGEQNLPDVIVGMAHDFTGSNNIQWFVPAGQFGTRFKGGADGSAARYINTRPHELFSYILRAEDSPILNYMEDEGEPVEPETYYPIIPMILVNGANGIGTGYSTYIPAHNPLDIINWLKLKLKHTPDEELPEVLPWYNRFKGTINVYDRRSKSKKIKDSFNVSHEMTEELNEFENHDDRELLSMTSKGSFYTKNDGTIVITELPIHSWPFDYHKKLEKWRDEKKISDFVDNSLDNEISFEIYKPKVSATYKSLGLEKTKGMSNMVLLDENNRPIRYNTSHDILNAFYYRRLPIYEKRKNYMMKVISETIPILKIKLTYIQAVVDKKLFIIDTDIASIHERLKELDIPIEVYKSSKTSDFTTDKIAKVNMEINKLKEELEIIKNTSVDTMWLNDLLQLESKYIHTYIQKKN